MYFYSIDIPLLLKIYFVILLAISILDHQILQTTKSNQICFFIFFDINEVEFFHKTAFSKWPTGFPATW